MYIIYIEYKKVQVKEGSVANMYPQLTVKGTGHDRTLGGMEMEIRLRDHLAKIFDVCLFSHCCTV